MDKKWYIRISAALFVLLIIISCASETGSEWETIFTTIQKKFPHAPVHDVVKLLYIGQFGNNHLLQDSTRAKAYFDSEWKSINPDTGMILLPLRPDSVWFLMDMKVAKFQHYKSEDLWKVIKNSARHSLPDTGGFIQAIHNYKQYALTKGNLTDKEIQYLDSLTRKIPSSIHHSKEFKLKFNPAYRIIHKKEWYMFTNR
ncbi:MAG: hypothetical protein Kow00108_03380 [Calditrichia bacterium]